MNNRNTDNLNDFDGGELPPDLAALARDLDALGALDAAGAPLGIEDRLWTATRAHVLGVPTDIAPVAAELDGLAHAERAAAPIRLESRAFELSREAIAGGLPRAATPALRITGQPERRPAVVVVDRFRFVRRAFAMAAVVALVGLGVGVYVASQPHVNVKPAPTMDLAERLDSEFSTLFEAVDLTHREAAASTRDIEGESDSMWLDDIYGEESL